MNALVCEDHPVNQTVITKILQKVGINVTLKANGKEEYDCFMKSRKDAFDIILMDIRMPIMDGYQASINIRKSNHPNAKSIPIIAMTANAFAEDIKKSMDAGMNLHLAKPIVPNKIYEAIEKVLESKNVYAVSKSNLLIVNETDDNLKLIDEIEEEYDVRIAKGGEEALTDLEHNSDFAAVITDLKMTGIDGITLIQTIRANPRYNNVAIIVNKENIDAKQEKKLKEIGADNFVNLKTSSEAIINQIKLVLEKK